MKELVRYKSILIIQWMMLLLAVNARQSTYAQAPASEYQVKAVFLYNFTRFIDWPPEAFKSPGDPFIIGIIGGDPFGSYLEDVVAGESVGTHPVIIKHFKEISEIDHCHILYINSHSSDFIKKVLFVTYRKSILTVNESANFPRLGGQVRFFTEYDKIRFQINTSATKDARLNVSSKLLSLSKIY